MLKAHFADLSPHEASVQKSSDLLAIHLLTNEDKLLDTEKPPLFEINFGAVIRGYRTEPYPSKPILEYLKARGAKFILSGDSHTVDNVMKAAEIMKAYSSS